MNAGRATAVEYIDAVTRQVHEAQARVIFLCASTIESLRILMNSRSTAHPEGLGASSGVLGRYLMDHIVGNVWFSMPEIKDSGRYDLTGADSILIPRFQNLGVEHMPWMRGFGMWGGIQRLPVPRLLRKKRNVAFGFLCTMAEALPDPDNRMYLDESQKDVFGLPVPYISCAWTDNDLKLNEAARAAAVEMVQAAGGIVEGFVDLVHTPLLTKFMKGLHEEWERTTPGLFVHEVGGADGCEPEGFRGQRVLPMLGRHEPVRDGRCVLGELGLAESNPDRDGDHGEGLCSCLRRTPAREPLTSVAP